MPGAWAIITMRATRHLPLLLEKLRVTEPGDYTESMLGYVYEHHNMFSPSLIQEYCPANYIQIAQSRQQERPPSRRHRQQAQIQHHQGQVQHHQGQVQHHQGQVQHHQGQVQHHQEHESSELLSEESDDEDILEISEKGTGFHHTLRRFCPAIVTPHSQRGPRRKQV